MESSELGRDGLRVVKGLCKSENFRALDNQVAGCFCLPVTVLALNRMLVCYRRVWCPDVLRSWTSPLTAAAALRPKSKCSCSYNFSASVPVKDQQSPPAQGVAVLLMLLLLLLLLMLLSTP